MSNKKNNAGQGVVNSSYFPPQQKDVPQYVSTGGAMPVNGVVGEPAGQNNMFAKKPLTFGTQELSMPVVAYDTTKDLEANLAGEGAPSVPDIISATNTPTQRAMRAEAQNVVPVVDPIDIEEIEYPELSEEQMRELAAKRKLQDTGPVVNGRSGRLGASLPVGGAAPRLSSPVDPMVLPRYNVNIPSGAAQPAAVVAPAVSTNFRAPRQVYSDAGMIAVANERASRVATPQAAPSVQVDPLVMQRQKMAGIQGKQAYDTAAAGSRIAAGQEKLDRMVQSTPSPYSGGISGTSMQRDKMNGQAIAEAERLEAIRQQMIADQQAIGRERMERMAQQTSSAPIGSSDTSIQNEKLAGIQSNQEYQRQLEADALGKAAAQERLDRMVQPIQETDQAQQNYNLFGNSKQQGYPGTATTHKSQEDQQAVYDDHEMKRYSREKGDYWGDPLGAQKWQAEENRRQKQQTQPVLDGSSSTAGMDYLNSLYTSPQDELKERRASRTRQRIMALGDALRHIGNIYNTVNYAPSQQFNDPVGEERKRYQKEKALRDANNYKYMTYQQAKAAQDAKIKQLEEENNYKRGLLQHYKEQDDRLAKQQELNERKADWQRQYQQGTLDIKKEQQALDREYRMGMLSVAQYRAATYALNAANGGSYPNGFDTYITYEPNQYDENNKLIKKGTQHTSRVPKKPAANSNLNLTGANGSKSEDNKNLGLKK